MAAVFTRAQQGMGIGVAGLGDPNVIIKRKFRWTMEVRGTNPTCPFYIPPYFVKVAARPNISFEETEINFLNDRMWIPGKATWEAITVTYMDVAGFLSGDAANGNLALYNWLMSVFDFRSPTKKFMGAKRSDYSAAATIRVFDGCGGEVENWVLTDAWPQAINFGDLDYASSDTLDIELTMRYSQVSFNHNCPTAQFNPCCTGCNTVGTPIRDFLIP